MKEKSVTSVLDIILDPSVMLIILGVIFGFISFFGCFGSLRENICFLKFVSIVIDWHYLAVIHRLKVSIL